jgi:hypothetical protein
MQQEILFGWPLTFSYHTFLCLGTFRYSLSHVSKKERKPPLFTVEELVSLPLFL